MECKSLFSELLVLLRLEHPNIVQCFGASLDLPLFGIVLELMEGGTLAEAIKGSLGLPVDVVLEYMCQVADAVKYMHTLDPPVVHRDLKPHNLLLDKSKRLCKVADLGLSRLMHHTCLTVTETPTGTPVFMSPEQWKG